MIPWLREANSVSLQQTLRDLDKAFIDFFSGTKGFPKPREHGEDHYRICGNGSFKVSDDWVRLPKMGWVRFYKSRDLPANAKIKNVSINRKCGKWFVSMCVEHIIDVKSAMNGAPVGLDLGVAQSVTFSDDTPAISMPVQTSAEERKIKRLYRQISRKQKGSKRRRKAVNRLAKINAHIVNRMTDAQHKLTTELANTRSEIHIEDLKIAKMTRSASGTVDNPGCNVKTKSALNRAMLGQAHGRMLDFLRYKCERSGAKLLFKNPAYTSQECAECHHVSHLNRSSQAVFACVKCGHKDNADHNAARVVLWRSPDGLFGAARGGSGESPANEPRTHRKTLQGVSLKLALERKSLPFNGREDVNVALTAVSGI